MPYQRIYLDESVLDAARARVRWVYREFPHVYVSISGGKDSTVILNLALDAAAELGRLPVPVLFLDQEAEWQHVIDHIRAVMADPRVSPRWLQVPFRLFNATSTSEPWLHCWEPGAQWIRPKEPGALTRNVYGTDRFKQMFAAFTRYHHPAAPVATLVGTRAEESPARGLALTTSETYRGVTWGITHDRARQHFAFCPIYDWTMSDVWKAIHDHGWPYTKLYDLMYQYGVPLKDMRVSNVHHETATRHLTYLQEIEPETWDTITRRIGGLQTVGQMREDFYGPRTLPPMFADWREYRDYLLAHLVTDPAMRAAFAHHFALHAKHYANDDDATRVELWKFEVQAILVNDFEGTKYRSFTVRHMTEDYRQRRDARRRAKGQATATTAETV